jgi:predicted nucleotidyltransferase
MLTVEQIRTVVADYFRDKPVKKVWLFGSYARGEADEKSDVDLLVRYDDAQRSLSWFDTLRLQLELQDKLRKDVQMVEDGRVYHRIIPFIDRDKIPIYEK